MAGINSQIIKNKEPKKQLGEIAGAKFLLILGVVLIHCNFSMELAENASSPARDLMLFISQFISQGSVPAFFAISGYLFFFNVKKFNREVYFGKLKSRVRTLLVPYLIWNGIGGFLFFIKYYLFGYPGYDIINESGFHFWRFLWGFNDMLDMYPYDFPLWFVRNLMFFVLLSPLVAIIGKGWWAWIFILVPSFTDIPFFQFQYFILGAWIAYHPRVWKSFLDKRITILSFAILLLSAYFLLHGFWSGSFGDMFRFLRNLSALALAIGIGGIMSNVEGVKMKKIYACTFIIFAFHGLCCALVRNYWRHLLGDVSFPSIIGSYFLSFVTLVLLSFIVYWVLKKISPKVLAVMSGGR